MTSKPPKATGPGTFDLRRLETLAREHACVEAILGNIPVADVHEHLQRVLAKEIQKRLEPGCEICDPRGEDEKRW